MKSSSSSRLSRSPPFSLSLNLLEPILFVNQNAERPLVLRGEFHLHVARTVKLSTLSLSFVGLSRSRRNYGSWDKEVIVDHMWTLCPDGTLDADDGPKVGTVYLKESSVLPSSATTTTQSWRALKRARQKFFGFLPKTASINGQRRRKPAKTSPNTVMSPGRYVYNFELALDAQLPETMHLDRLDVSYFLQVVAKRGDVCGRSATRTQEVTLVRCPEDAALEQVEPISVSKKWEDQVFLNVIVSGRAGPLGGHVPVAVRLDATSQLKSLDLKISLTESVVDSSLQCSAARLLLGQRQELLFHSVRDGSAPSADDADQVLFAGTKNPFRASDCGFRVCGAPDVMDLNYSTMDSRGATVELEMDVQLPAYRPSPRRGRSSRLHQGMHFDVEYKNVQVKHWLKFVMTAIIIVSSGDGSQTERRCRLSTQVPYRLRSSHVGDANLSVPAYRSTTCPSVLDCIGSNTTAGSPAAARPSDGNRESLSPPSPLANMQAPPPPSRPGMYSRCPSYRVICPERSECAATAIARPHSPPPAYVCVA